MNEKSYDDFWAKVRLGHEELAPWREERKRQFKRYCEEVIPAIYGDSAIKPEGDSDERED